MSNFRSASPVMTAQTQVRLFSREYFLERLGPELVADIEARVAAAPSPSLAKVEEIRRLFAAVPLTTVVPLAPPAPAKELPKGDDQDEDDQGAEDVAA